MSSSGELSMMERSEELDVQRTSKKTKTGTKYGAIKTTSNNTIRYCRFEDSTFDSKTHKWVHRDLERVGLRMCPRLDCTFTHRIPRPRACELGKDCVSYTCNLLHPKDRSKVCRYGARCWHSSCNLAHPDGRPEECCKGSMCLEFAEGGFNECPKLHPSVIQKVCRFRDNCKRYGCHYIHSDLSPQDCVDGMQCQYRCSEDTEELGCSKKHPRFTRRVQDTNGQYRYA